MVRFNVKVYLSLRILSPNPSNQTYVYHFWRREIITQFKLQSLSKLNTLDKGVQIHHKELKLDLYFVQNSTHVVHFFLVDLGGGLFILFFL